MSNRKNPAKNFIRDHLGFTSVYFLSSLLIMAFFYVTNENRGEFLYPLVISSFIYIFYTAIRWVGYYRFHTSLIQSAVNPASAIDASNAGQREVVGAIAAIQQKYAGEVSRLKASQKSWKHFLSQWIHNMKTPVSVIDLIVQKMSAEGTAGGRIDDIRDENLKLLNSLEQVLNIMRLEDFAKDYVPETIDLAASVLKVINEKRSQFIYSNVFPKFSHDGTPVAVLSDAKWNLFMLDQLVSNAIKYSSRTEQVPGTNVHFTIKPEGDRVVLTIEDEGIGIPEYDLPRVFEPFFTGENGRKFRNSTGIGLYVCKAIADRLGHRLSIRSEAGRGTAVSISYLSKM